MKISFRIILLLAIPLFSLTACKKHKTLVEIGNEQQILHISNYEEPADVDPQTTTGIPEYRLQMAIFEGLTSKHPKTLEVLPAAADRWDISDDGLSYKFHIRDTAKWSDGTKVTAYDFEYAWKRALTPSLGCEYANDFFLFKNAEAFYKGELSDFGQVGIKAINDSVFEVTLNHPISFFLTKLDHQSFYPVQKKLLEKFNASGDRSTGWTRPENIITNGPFKVKQWVPSFVFSVVPNPYYWDAENVKLKEIRFYPISSLLQEERMFRAGQLHKTEFLPSAKVDVYKGKPEYINFDYYGSYYYAFNTKVKPLDDVRVRKALSYSIDRESIVKDVVRGGQAPAFHYTPNNPFGYKAAANMVYDIALAKKLLADAGFPNGKGFPELTLLYNTQADHLKIALAIQQMWKNNLGINIVLKNMEWKVYLNERNLRNFDILRRGGIGDVLDPSTFFDSMRSGDPMNDTDWGSAKFDALLKSAQQARTNEDRYSLFQEADQILVDEAPLMPIYFYTTNNLLSPSVKGYYKNILDYHPYNHVYLESSD